MKRVLQVVAGLTRGGIQSFILNIYKVIDREKIQFDFLVSFPGGTLEQEIMAMGGRIYYVLPRNAGCKKSKESIESFFKDHAYEYCAIHIHVSSLSSIMTLEYAYKFGIPIRILHSHSSSIQKSVKFHWVHTLLHYIHKYKVHRYATHYWGCSDKAIDWLFKYTGVYSKAQWIHNGINCKDYSFDKNLRKIVRNEFGIKDNELVLGHVGRFIPLKNQAFLIDILHEAVKHRPTKLMLVGDGETRKAVQEMCVKKNILDKAIFTGERADVYRLMQAMDVFVMPSWFEGLPLVLVEAQASGLPVVVSDTISKGVNFTNTILYKSIQDTAEQWYSSISQWQQKVGRTSNIELLKKAGYDSLSTAQQLMAIYLENDVIHK